MSEAGIDFSGDGTAAPRDAATILVLRGGAARLEVFMLERHIESDFAGGALVFPGGTVDEPDRHLPPDRFSGLDPVHEGRRLGVDPATALGLHVAAVREAYEEAGVLLARRDGRPVGPGLLASESAREARRRLADRDTRLDWAGWLASEGLVLDLGTLAPWSWWVTPAASPRRYDTRFLVTHVPHGQARGLSHDEVETTASRWTGPREALAAAADGSVTVVYPTRRNLAALADHPSARSAVAAARTGRADTRRIQPTVEVRDGEVLVHHPDGGRPERVAGPVAD